MPASAQPRVAQSVILNRAVFAAWGTWFAYQIFFLATQPIWDSSWRRSVHNSSEWGSEIGAAFGGPVLVGLAAWLALAPLRQTTTIVADDLVSRNLRAFTLEILGERHPPVHASRAWWI